jgi:hypothetical protein
LRLTKIRALAPAKPKLLNAAIAAKAVAFSGATPGQNRGLVELFGSVTIHWWVIGENDLS